MSEALLVLTVVGGFLIAFPLIWLLVLNLIARLGGWASLAEEFPARGEPRGDHFSWRSGTVGWLGSYRNALDVWVSSNGLWLRPVAIFRAGHKPMMIPWSAVEQAKKRTFMIAVDTLIVVRRPGRTTTLTVYGEDIAQSIARHAPSKLFNDDSGPGHR